jgi:hypothetical protein
MNIKSAMSKFLTNKWVLNIVALIALFNIIGYIVLGKLNTTLYFIVIAILVRYFSKNMVLVLGIPLILVNLLSLRGSIMEGMENKSVDNSKDATQQKKIDKLVKKNQNKQPSGNSNLGYQTGPVDHSQANDVKHDEESHEDNAAQSTSGEQQGFEPGRGKNNKYNIDYASTVEDAYDELNTILGSDGIQRLTSDTQNLMKQQMQLAEAMKGMTPIIKSIAPMVENLKGMMGQMGDGKDGLGGIMDLAKQFSSQAAPAK